MIKGYYSFLFPLQCISNVHIHSYPYSYPHQYSHSIHDFTFPISIPIHIQFSNLKPNQTYISLPSPTQSSPISILSFPDSYISLLTPVYTLLAWNSRIVVFLPVDANSHPPIPIQADTETESETETGPPNRVPSWSRNGTRNINTNRNINII